MSFFDILSTSFINLYRRKARTLLTVLGVIIGTASIVLMVALGEGSTQTFMEEVSRSTDLTRIEINAGYQPQGSQASVKLDDDAVKSFEKMENVRAVLPVTQVSMYLKSARYAGDIYLNAVPMIKLKELYLDKLEWDSPATGKDINFYLGKSMAEWNFYKYQPGKQIWEMPQATDIDFKTEEFDVYFGGSYLYTSDQSGLEQGITLPEPMHGKIGGIFSETGGELDYAGYMDLDVVKSFAKKNKAFCEAAGISGNYGTVYIYTKDMDSVADVLAAVKELGYEAYSPMSYIQDMQEESRRQQAQWGAVGAIALIVSAIGIVNTMTTSIMERKREIGVLKVLGCSLGNISTMFLVEAAIIGMLGGLLGVALSYLVSVGVTLIPVNAEGGSFLGSFFGSGVRFIIKPIIAVAAIVGAAIIGMIAGIIPSVRAMKMPPLAALRDE